MNGHLILIGGSSGIGKTTLVSDLVSAFGSYYARPLSYTTRARRVGEDDSEYAFVSPTALRSYYRTGRVVRLDEVYGQLYGIDRLSLETLVSEGKCAIKEVHPANHSAVRSCVACPVISVLLRPPREVAGHGRDDRESEDLPYFSRLSPDDFDLVIDTPARRGNEELGLIHERIQSLLRVPRSITTTARSKAGYARVATEFTDDRRITTANFHQLTKAFLQSSIDQFVVPGSCGLDLGAGRGWSRSNLKWPTVFFTAVDLTHQMFEGVSDPAVVAACEQLPFGTNRHDWALASLADPFCYSAALKEIRRVIVPGGTLILTCPAKEWASLLRTPEKLDETAFLLHDATEVRVPSFTHTSSGLTELLTGCGFKPIRSASATIKNLSHHEKASPVLTRAQGLGSPDVPVVHMCCCEAQ